MIEDSRNQALARLKKMRRLPDPTGPADRTVFELWDIETAALLGVYQTIADAVFIAEATWVANGLTGLEGLALTAAEGRMRTLVVDRPDQWLLVFHVFSYGPGDPEREADR